jgi:hypothetical protein
VRIVDVAATLTGEPDHLLVRVVADRPEGRELDTSKYTLPPA